jgi:SAM-dependent methyltransferase
LRLSGEQRDFFARGRVASLIEHLPAGFQIRRVLDYGCGSGETAARLADEFPDAEIVGADNSRNVIESAGRRFRGDRISFIGLDCVAHQRPFDLCYVNGVFHHLKGTQRSEAVARIFRALRPGGLLALFENNPWNPGARAVMSRIPFDRDAEMISIPSLKRLLREGGFGERIESWSLFYFPSQLSWLRPLERGLEIFPLGAQYCALAARELPTEEEMQSGSARIVDGQPVASGPGASGEGAGLEAPFD